MFFFPSLGPFPNTLRQVEVEIISNDICNEVHVYGGAVSSGMICAGFLTGKLDACEVRLDTHPKKMNLLNRDELTDYKSMTLHGSP